MTLQNVLEKDSPKAFKAADCEARFREARGDGLDALLQACENAHRVRPGDLRYHQINVIEAPQTPSPWGIYTDSEDPLTGETIAASINVWSWVNDFWAQSVVDQMRVIKGELSIEDVTEGEYIRNWESAAKKEQMVGIFMGIFIMTMSKNKSLISLM